MARADYQTVCINRKDEIGVLAVLYRWLPISESSNPNSKPKCRTHSKLTEARAHSVSRHTLASAEVARVVTPSGDLTSLLDTVVS